MQSVAKQKLKRSKQREAVRRGRSREEWAEEGYNNQWKATTRPEIR